MTPHLEDQHPQTRVGNISALQEVSDVDDERPKGNCPVLCSDYTSEFREETVRLSFIRVVYLIILAQVIFVLTCLIIAYRHM